MRCLAVDPGATTGVALWLSGPKPATYQLPVNDAVDLCLGLLQGQPATLVVCETFVPRPGAKSWQPDAIETLGFLRHTARQQRHKFELQSPADAKRFSTDVKLRKLDWYKTTEGGHINDALRHLLLALVRHDEIDLGRLT
jgi:hypothetical protein